MIFFVFRAITEKFKEEEGIYKWETATCQAEKGSPNGNQESVQKIIFWERWSEKKSVKWNCFQKKVVHVIVFIKVIK